MLFTFGFIGRETLFIDGGEVKGLLNSAKIVAPLSRENQTNLEFCAVQDGIQNMITEGWSDSSWTKCTANIAGLTLSYSDVTNNQGFASLPKSENLLVTTSFLPDLFPMSELTSTDPGTYVYIPYYKLYTLKGIRGISEDKLEEYINEIAEGNWSTQALLVDMNTGKAIPFGV